MHDDIFLPRPELDVVRVRVERTQRLVFRSLLDPHKALMGLGLEDLGLDPDLSLANATKQLVGYMEKAAGLPELFAYWDVIQKEQRVNNAVTIYVDGEPIVTNKEL